MPENRTTDFRRSSPRRRSRPTPGGRRTGSGSPGKSRRRRSWPARRRRRGPSRCHWRRTEQAAHVGPGSSWHDDEVRLFVRTRSGSDAPVTAWLPALVPDVHVELRPRDVPAAVVPDLVDGRRRTSSSYPGRCRSRRRSRRSERSRPRRTRRCTSRTAGCLGGRCSPYPTRRGDGSPCAPGSARRSGIRRTSARSAHGCIRVTPPTSSGTSRFGRRPGSDWGRSDPRRRDSGCPRCPWSRRSRGMRRGSRSPRWTRRPERRLVARVDARVVVRHRHARHRPRGVPGLPRRERPGEPRQPLPVEVVALPVRHRRRCPASKESGTLRPAPWRSPSKPGPRTGVA